MNDLADFFEALSLLCTNVQPMLECQYFTFFDGMFHGLNDWEASWAMSWINEYGW